VAIHYIIRFLAITGYLWFMTEFLWAMSPIILWFAWLIAILLITYKKPL
jgi:hypothetical protein